MNCRRLTAARLSVVEPFAQLFRICVHSAVEAAIIIISVFWFCTVSHSLWSQVLDFGFGFAFSEVLSLGPGLNRFGFGIEHKVLENITYSLPVIFTNLGKKFYSLITEFPKMRNKFLKLCNFNFSRIQDKI